MTQPAAHATAGLPRTPPAAASEGPGDAKRLEVLSPPAGMALQAVPAWAAARRQATGCAVCVAGVVTSGRALQWLDSEHARGWVLLEPATPVNAVALQAAYTQARARGFVDADAAMLALGALCGQLPRLSWGEAPDFAAHDAAHVPSDRGVHKPGRVGVHAAGAGKSLGLYAIVDSADRLAAVLAAGVTTAQVRIKRPPQPDAVWEARLKGELARAIALADAAGAELFINDHVQTAQALGARAIHLGQEDLLALGDAGRRALVASGLALGISSHSVWELCRARALPARYIACGPVWATTTKDMPWVPQGLDNLAWWCRHAGAPVVAIGGILEPAQVEETAACGPDGVCLVRGLGDDPRATLPAFEAALNRGRARAGATPSSAALELGLELPLHPSLPHSR